MSLNVNYKESFQNRHIGPNENEKNDMICAYYQETMITLFFIYFKSFFQVKIGLD